MVSQALFTNKMKCELPVRFSQTKRLAGKATITGGLCLGRSEVLRSLRHKAGRKAKDIAPSIAWRREAWKEEALDDLP